MTLKPITMPKWGLAMQEGTLVKWAVAEGQAIKAGQEIADIETSKIANVFESPVEGVLARLVAKDGDLLPVGALLGVVAEAKTPSVDVDAYIAEFQANFKTEGPAKDDGPQPQIIEAGGKKLRYLVMGDGDATPILLIHGYGADLGAWMFNQGALAESRKVYALDLPGHGNSVKDVGDGTPVVLAKDVVALLDALSIAKAHLVGHSLGGAIATLIAHQHPDRVTALTLVAPWGLGTEISSAFIDGYLAETRPKKLRPVLEMLVANPEQVTGDMVEDVLKAKRLDGAVESLGKIARNLAVADRQPGSVRELLAAIKCPVQVLWGEADRILPASQSGGLPSAVKVTRFPGAGHIVHMEKAAEITAAISNLA